MMRASDVMDENEYIPTISVHCLCIASLLRAAISRQAWIWARLRLSSCPRRRVKGLMKASGSDWPNCGLLGHSAEKAS
jgi:hypothetical protein